MRKTVSVVFSDLAGSTALQEALDAESVRHVMGRFYAAMRGAVEEYGGRVQKFIGDAVVAVWGVPVVGEDDALQAVRAAGAMVRALQVLNAELEAGWGVRLRLRTGVNTGEVVVSREGFLVGDTMNTGARLEQAAPEGEVLVGEATWRLVRGRVGLQEVEPVAAKGKREPVRAFRLLRDGGGPAAAHPEAPLVGRSAELGRLRAAFDGAARARRCRLVTVIGSPGIGKTRLAAALADAVAGEAMVVEGRCEPTGEGITFLPVADVLRDAAGIGEADPPEAVMAKLRAVAGDDGDADRIATTAAGVLGVGAATAPEETFWAVRRLLEAMARSRPLLVLLDDVHWGEPQFLDLVEHLVDWVRDAPILLVALARPELREARRALTRREARPVDVVELSPLDAQESRELVRGLLGEVEVPAELAGRMLGTTGGNPLFLGELLRMLVDDGTLRREGDGDAWVLAPDADVDVPPTVEALLSARLERLGPGERSVVERASVIGKQFVRGAVAQLAPPPVAAGVDAHLEALRRKEMVEPDGTFWIDEPVFRFHHVLIRDAAYRSLLKEARSELHERFADWLEAKAGELAGEHEEVIAFHVEQAHEYRRQLGPLDARGRALGARARARLASAGRRALAREDLAAAANLLRRADARTAEADPEVLVDLCDALLSAGAVREAGEPIGRLREAAAGDPRLHAIAAVSAAHRAWLVGERDPAVVDEPLAAAVAALRAAGDGRRLAQARELQATVEGTRARNAAAEAALDEGLGAARAAGDQRRVAAILSLSPLAALWGPTPVARASGRCLDVVRILRMTPGTRHVEARALRVQALLEAMRGRDEAARALLRSARGTFEELGLELDLAETDVLAARVHLVAGEPAEAEAHVRRAADGFRRLGVGGKIAEALLARALVEQGRDAEALALVRRPRPADPLRLAVLAGTVLAEVLARRGEHGQAQELALDVVARAREGDALVDRAEALESLALVLRTAGDEAGARTAMAEAHETYVAKGHEVGATRTAPADAQGATPASAAAPAAPPGAPASPLGAFVQEIADAVNRRDFDGAIDLLTDDFVAADHRQGSPLGPRADADTFVQRMRFLASSAPDVRGTVDAVLGEAGDAVACRFAWRGHLDDGGGAFETPMLLVARRRGGGTDRIELFDEGAQRAALDRLAELAGAPPAARSTLVRRPDAELPPHETALERAGRRFLAAYDARDRVRLRAAFSDDLSFMDHRVATTFDEPGGAEQHVERLTALWAHVRSITWRIEALAGGEHTGLCDNTVTGELADGGAFELRFLHVAGERDGRIGALELFDADAEDAARTRLAELDGARPVDAVVRALNARDWHALRAAVSPDLVVEDRRASSMPPSVRGSEAWLERQRAAVRVTPDLQWSLDPLRARPGRLLARLLAGGHHHQPGGVADVTCLVHVAHDGAQVTRWEVLDPDVPAAIARFDAVTRVVECFPAAFNAHDWPAFRDFLQPDVFVADHRPVSTWGEEVRDRDTYVQRLQALLRDAPDTRFEVIEGSVVDGEQAVAGVFDVSGHWADGGGAFTMPRGIVAALRDGRISRIEYFEADDEAGRLARWGQLDATGDSPILTAAARYAAAIGRGDLQDVRACLDETLAVCDHRPTSPLGARLDGAAAYLERVAALLEVATDLRATWELLEDRGTAGLARMRYAGSWRDGGGPFVNDFLLVATLAGSRYDRFEIFPTDAEPDARARLETLTGGKELLADGAAG